VIFSNAGTIAKFNRIGVLAGFAATNHKYYRLGYQYDPDPTALQGIPFHADVSSPNYDEYWGDEVQVFHNPRAIHPLPLEAVPDAVQYSYQNGRLTVIAHEGRVLGSMTAVFQILNSDDQPMDDQEAIFL